MRIRDVQHRDQLLEARVRADTIEVWIEFDEGHEVALIKGLLKPLETLFLIPDSEIEQRSTLGASATSSAGLLSAPQHSESVISSPEEGVDAP